MKKDTHSYKGWLNSDDFVKRALAVWGYAVVAHMGIAITVVAVVSTLSFLFG